jgi:shikimate dehydrogenase
VAGLVPRERGEHGVLLVSAEPAARLAVLGSPIAHSLSPALQGAAYRVLGLDWSYEAVDVAEGALGAFLETLDPSWRGLSLTMPLKREVLPHLDERSELVELVGAANTVLFARGAAGARVRGFNTDVDGIVRALADHGIATAETVHVLGMGATAASTVVAAARLGARAIVVTGRRSDDDELRRLSDAGGIALRFRAPGSALPEHVDLLVNTIPGDLDDVPEVDEAAVFLEVSYADWPSPRARRWLDAGRPVVSGLEMLLHQAIGQVRIFVGGREDAVLERETEVVAAMRASVGL